MWKGSHDNIMLNCDSQIGYSVHSNDPIESQLQNIYTESLCLLFRVEQKYHLLIMLNQCDCCFTRYIVCVCVFSSKQIYMSRKMYPKTRNVHSFVCLFVFMLHKHFAIAINSINMYSIHLIYL